MKRASIKALAQAIRRWEGEARATFLDAYATAAGSMLFDDWSRMQPLLDLFILEKTLYEVRYELAQRPDWVGIPLRGLHRLFAPG